jgi:hypothetical protein
MLRNKITPLIRESRSLILQNAGDQGKLIDNLIHGELGIFK